MYIDQFDKVKFDEGYFFIGDVLGVTPDIEKITCPPREYLIELIKQLDVVIPQELFTSVMEGISKNTLVILMTSNFSEAGKISLANELKAYEEFLLKQNFKKQSVLIIKPHPRDSPNKINTLHKLISPIFSNVFVLNHPKLFFLPFEVIYFKYFFNTPKLKNKIIVITFSTACFSFPLLFNSLPIIGLGKKIIKKYFHKDHQITRIKHEKDLMNGLKILTNRYL